MCVMFPHFSSSSPSLMLLMEAEAPFGDEGGEVRGMAQRDGGDGERDGENSLGGLLLGEQLGENAWIIRPLRSWNICFWKNEKVIFKNVSILLWLHLLSCVFLLYTYTLPYILAYPCPIWTKELQEIPNELSWFLLPLLDKIMALLFHSIHKVLGLLLYRPHLLFHPVHLILQTVLLFLWERDQSQISKIFLIIIIKCQLNVIQNMKKNVNVIFVYVF